MQHVMYDLKLFGILQWCVVRKYGNSKTISACVIYSMLFENETLIENNVAVLCCKNTMYTDCLQKYKLTLCLKKSDIEFCQ